MVRGSRGLGGVVGAALAFCAISAVGPSSAQTPGGFVESATAGVARPALSASQVSTFLPAGRGAFTFPPPYNTQGVRITADSDCGGQDCIFPVGYSYWRNINNHVGSNTMLIFLGLNRSRGGGGPTLFSYDKSTGEVTNRGPLFDPGSAFSAASGEGWYFSASQPTTLYVNLPVTSSLLRYDVLSHTFSPVFDVASRPDLFGPNRYLWQFHSSNDDRVHSATLRDAGSFAELGCLAYREDTGQFFYFPQKGFAYDECQIDKSGRWLLIKEKLGLDPASEVDNRIIDLNTGAETDLLDRNGAGGHSDNGFGYMVAADNWANQPGAIKLWKFGPLSATGALVYQDASWATPGLQHVSHANATPGAPEAQYACGSGASAVNGPRANEVMCFPLDGSLRVLVVAPVMTDMNAPGGGDSYSKLPKGNLDVTGQYFLWTSNTGGSRLDAFLVKVPQQLVTTSNPSPPLPAPPSSAPTPTPAPPSTAPAPTPPPQAPAPTPTPAPPSAAPTPPDAPATPMLTVAKAGPGSGSVVSTPAGISCGTDCSEAYVVGAAVTLRAQPAIGSVFTGWDGACAGQSNPCTITVSTNQSVTASFAGAVRLSVRRWGLVGNGAVISNPMGITCGGDCSQMYARGTVVTLTVTSSGPVASGYSWGGACAGQGATCRLTMDTNKSVSVRFRRPSLP